MNLAPLRIIVSLSVSFAFLTALYGCATSSDKPTSAKSVSVFGSDTMAPLMVALSRDFTEKHPGIKVAIVNSDSGTGIASLLFDKADIASTSRDLTEDEKITAHKRDKHLKKMMIARDAITVVVNPKNRISELTLDDLRSIFTREKSNWKELGGTDSTIEVLARESDSGTSKYFKEHVLQGHAYSKGDKVLGSAEEVLKRVIAEPNSIGYVGLVQALEFGSKVKIVRLKLVETAGGGVAPSKESLVANYPLGRPLYLLTTEPAKEEVEKFLKFCLGEEGQDVIEAAGFVKAR